MNSKKISTVLFLILVTLTLSCTREKNDAQSKKQILQASIRLAWVYDMAEVGIFVAKQQGFYDKEGIDLKIEPGGFGLDPFKLVAAGTNDFGVGGAGNLIMARGKGIPVIAVGAEFQNTPVGFITKADSMINSFKDFKGKKVGVQTGADTDVLYQALLTKYGMTSNDVKEVPIQYEMTPFVSGEIDVLPGYVTNQPIQLFDKGINTKLITAKSEGLRYYGNVYFVRENTLKEHPELVAKFLKATLAGWEHAILNKKDAISAVKYYAKDFDDKGLDRIYDAVIPFIKPDEPNVKILGMSTAKWESTYDVLIKAKLLSNQVPISSLFTQN